MKKGKTLTELARELDRQLESREDYVADTRNLTLKANGSTRLEIAGVGEYGVTPHTHGQIADRLKIPKRFYDRMLQDHPDILESTVNPLFQREHENRMIRTLDGNARAFLSNRYRRLDNYEVMATALPVLQEDPSLRIMSADVTDTKLYLKVVSPKVEGEVKVGEPVQGGLIISNSEIGKGALSVHPLIYTLSCSNGLIVPLSGMRKYHIGRATAEEEMIAELLSDEATKADDEAFMLKVRDIIRAAMSQASFAKILENLQQSTKDRVDDPILTVEKLGKKYGMTEAERTGVLNTFYEDSPTKGLTRYGLLSAVTRYSQEIESYDRATDFETLGGQILDLPKSEWKTIAA
jgi:hypothetical protein